jgi:hypothetical protein
MPNRILAAGRLVMLVMLTMGFAGCTSVPMPKGSSKGYSTVRFVTPNPALAEDNLPQFIEAHRMIKASITDQMQQHGVQVVDQNADLLVAYLVVLQDNVKTSYSNQYYGYQDFMKIVDAAFKARLKKSYPEEVEERILVVDLIDARTFKLVYRDYAISEPVANLSEADRQAVINRVVAAALQPFFAK